MMLVTLQQASDDLRRDTSADDADLTLKIHAASGMVMSYITESPYTPAVDGAGAPVLDETGAPVYTEEVLPEVQMAVLLMVRFLYKPIDEAKAGGWDDRGYLPTPVASVIRHLRVPGMA